MWQHGLDAPRPRLKALEAQQRVEPDQPATRAVQAVDFEFQFLHAVALQSVGDQEHHRPAAHHTAPPMAIEAGKCRADPRAAGPIGHLRRAGSQRLVRVAVTQRPRHVGEPRAEQEDMAAPPLFHHRMAEREKDPAVLAHRTGNIDEDDEWRGFAPPAAEFRQHQITAGAHGRPECRLRIKPRRMRRRLKAARGHGVQRHHEPCDLAPRQRQFPRTHLGEIGLAQHF